jgi:hypothetical protein
LNIKIQEIIENTASFYDQLTLYGTAITQFAFNGDDEYVISCLTYSKETIAKLHKLALYSYARELHLAQINDLSSKYKITTDDFVVAVNGFVKCGVINGNESLLVGLVSHLNDISLREMVVNKAIVSNAKLNKKSVLMKAQRLHTVMKDNQFDYGQAMDWIQIQAMPLALHIWLINIYQISKRSGVPMEIMKTITAEVLNKPNYEASQLIDLYLKSKVKKFYEQDLSRSTQTFFQSNLKSEKSAMNVQLFQEAQNAAHDRYMKRSGL